MKPQDRTRAILRSGLEQGLAWTLIAICDYMGRDDVTFVRPDTIAKDTGGMRSTIFRQITELRELGILLRTPGERPSHDMRIDWARLAAYQRPTSWRGGFKQKRPKMVQDPQVVESHLGTKPVPSWDCGSPILGLNQSHLGTAGVPSWDPKRPLSDHLKRPPEATSQATSTREADRLDVDRFPVDDGIEPPDGLDLTGPGWPLESDDFNHSDPSIKTPALCSPDRDDHDDFNLSDPSTAPTLNPPVAEPPPCPSPPSAPGALGPCDFAPTAPPSPITSPAGMASPASALPTSPAQPAASSTSASPATRAQPAPSPAALPPRSEPCPSTASAQPATGHTCLTSPGSLSATPTPISVASASERFGAPGPKPLPRPAAPDAPASTNSARPAPPVASPASPSPTASSPPMGGPEVAPSPKAPSTPTASPPPASGAGAATTGSPRLFELGSDPAPKQPAAKAAPKAAPTPSDEDLLYAVWRAAHPRAPLTPTPTNRKALKAILAETGADGALYLTWVAQSDDQAAARLRGAAPWPGGEVVARDDLVSLSRHIPSRLPLAQAWEKRGRKPSPRAPEPARTSPSTSKPGPVILDQQADGTFAPAGTPRYSFRTRQETHYDQPC